MGVARFDNETVGVHPTRVVLFVSSALDALELDARTIVEVLGFAERSDDTVLGADHNSPACSSDPSS